MPRWPATSDATGAMPVSTDTLSAFPANARYFTCASYTLRA